MQNDTAVSQRDCTPN